MNQTGGFTMRNNKGFTLVEMAIVLVIIGIILGAVIKGNDLIAGAQTKSVVQMPSKWEVPIWGFYDKLGYLPGDSGKTGTLQSFAQLQTDLTNASFAVPSSSVNGVNNNILSIASICGSTSTRNAMLISNLTADQATALDTAIDGTANGTTGRVRNCAAAGATAGAAWPATGTVTATYMFDKLP